MKGAVLAGLAFWAGAVAGAGEQVTPLRWGADAEGGAPYVFYDPQAPGGLTGFEVEVAEALGKEMGRPLVFHQ